MEAVYYVYAEKHFNKQAQQILKDPKVSGKWIIVLGRCKSILPLCRSLVYSMRLYTELHQTIGRTRKLPRGVCVKDVERTYVHFDREEKYEAGQQLID